MTIGMIVEISRCSEGPEVPNTLKIAGDWLQMAEDAERRRQGSN